MSLALFYIGSLKLIELGKLSFEQLSWVSHEASFGMLNLCELGRVSLGMLKLISYN